MSFPMKDLGAGPYPHEVPSTRFPVYTRGNAGEVWPEVAYPLSVSMSRSAPDPVMDTIRATGMVRPEETDEGITIGGGCYGGYMYLNLSFNRVMALRSPGVTIADNDAIYLGSDGLAPPHVLRPGDKSLKASVNAVRYMLGVLGTTELPQLAEDIRLVADRRAAMADELRLDDAELLAALRRRNVEVMRLFDRHIDVSSRAGAAVQYLAGLCEKRFGDRTMALSLVAGVGDVASAAPSWGLWELGRLVAADEDLTAAFDAGIDGLADRLADLPAAEAFNVEFGGFIETFGSRGPNEWETASDTWETRPELALALVDRLRGADERQAPEERAKTLAAERGQLVVETRDRLPRFRRRSFDKALAAASLFSMSRERTKTTVIDLIHQSRLLTRELAGRVASRVEGGTIEDLWFCLEEELDDYLDDPAALAGVIAQRRATREALSLRIPPFVFEGALPPVDEWELRADAVSDQPLLAAGDSISGLSAVTGVAEGRACIVTDPFDPGDLGPGDVLVAPLTDPAWTPLFIAAEAVVVDVGGQMSHAVIVAREFGMPCVVAATDATSRIPHGARVRVDGSTGTVTLLE